ncbi:MAG: hypothetical protein Q4G49_14650 [Paracoccus sp. (in: a-proteobacteria)]|nr:hypothetical protein [Paracoccus sp. (in: a-proteobacteria)]
MNDAAHARDWIASVSARPGGTWQDHGDLILVGDQVFIGDPTWGSDHHIENPIPALAPHLRVWALRDDQGDNLAIWLENTGAQPFRSGQQIEFGIDAAMFAPGTLAAGQALVDLGERHKDQGIGDSFDWLCAQPVYAHRQTGWLTIPPGDHAMFLATTHADGGFAATWLMDSDGALSGILIDIRGSHQDGMFIDQLLPPPERNPHVHL